MDKKKDYIIPGVLDSIGYLGLLAVFVAGFGWGIGDLIKILVKGTSKNVTQDVIFHLLLVIVMLVLIFFFLYSVIQWSEVTDKGIKLRTLFRTVKFIEFESMTYTVNEKKITIEGGHGGERVAFANSARNKEILKRHFGGFEI